MKKRLLTIFLILSLLTSFSNAAHPGRTDSSGGHRDNKNQSGLGYYHYHCGGYPPHLHENGKCPYRSTSSSNSSSKNNSSSSKTISAKSTTQKSEIKAIQEKLNSLGYDCGKVDGIMGKKTKNAIKQFQKDKGLVVDGIVGPKTKAALGL